VSLEDQIAQALLAVRFHVSDEDELQGAIARVLSEAGIPHEREVCLSPKNRIDFMAADIGIEVKVQGTAGLIAEQLQRYAACPQVRTLLLVTTRHRYGRFEGMTFLGKTVRVIRVTGGFL
jgi:hypothetical protein